MDFVSVKMISWMLLFPATAWIPSYGRHPWFLTVLGSAFVFTSAPLAGAILYAETLLCYFSLRRDNTRAFVRVLLLTVVLSAAFLLCKYYASRGVLVLPLGISFFTFRLIHYSQIRWRGTVRPHSMIEFLAYMTFLPTFLVGPINLFPDFLKDLRRRHWDGGQFSWGLERVFYGFALLIIGGNFLINAVCRPWMDAAVSQSGDVPGLFLQSILLWLDLYVRFSAYSGIAIGLSAMAGYRAPENFDAPFFSANIREFWRRWHMSLTGWGREYIAGPIAAATRRPYLAAAATMVAIGIWHELSLRYVLWGLYHFAGIAIHRKWSARRKETRITTPIFQKASLIAGTAGTTLFVISSFPVTTLITRLIESALP
jgi:D-alanyl-lipoteichoic acid acyltransferase DltB (MBOAT superfamily)